MLWDRSTFPVFLLGCVLGVLWKIHTMFFRVGEMKAAALAMKDYHKKVGDLPINIKTGFDSNKQLTSCPFRSIP